MNAVRTTAEPYWDLVEQSLEEAAFFWKRWEADLESLTRSLDDVWSWTEDRLHGALDGVRVGRRKNHASHGGQPAGQGSRGDYGRGARARRADSHACP